MFFIDENIPQQFQYIAEISDNYIVLVKDKNLTSGRDYEAYYQFFNPSTQVLHINNYRIKNNTSGTFDVNYRNDGLYSYINNITTSNNVSAYEFEKSNELFDRPDIPLILLMVFFGVCLTILITNLATSLVHRGGIFHG